MLYRVLTVIVSTVALSAGLTACGSGGVSTGAAGGGGGNTRASSSLVVEVTQDGEVAGMQGASDRDKQLLSAISDLLISKAMAQTAGVPIYIDGEQVAVTDDTGSAVIPLVDGTYQVCIFDTTPTNCTTVTVAPDSVVVISDVNVDQTTGDVTFGPVVTELASDNIVAFQDPDNDKKTLVCHKGRFTISVGTPAAMNGHLGHGDSLGACPVSETDQETIGTLEIDEGAANGNNGDNGNKGNKGNKENRGNGNSQNS